MTLRCATQGANSAPAHDTKVIDFDILPVFGNITNDCQGAPSVCTIEVITPLPAISTPNVTINGYTQPGARPNSAALGDNAVLTIRLDGAYESANQLGGGELLLNSSGARIKGLSWRLIPLPGLLKKGMHVTASVTVPGLTPTPETSEFVPAYPVG